MNLLKIVYYLGQNNMLPLTILTVKHHSEPKPIVSGSMRSKGNGTSGI